ncbi:ATP-grasp domain-containing protein [Streptomyces sp. NPDC058783]|uniref:ATP-grasp domain-containing protein n=1 Tax=Streptomyces sp. NPDC058783 TaxID=3346633 RepID=UPI00369AF030
MTGKTPLMLVVGLSLSTGLPAFINACHRQGVKVAVMCEPFRRDTHAAQQLTELYERRLALADEYFELPALDAVRVLGAVRHLSPSFALQGVYAGADRHVETVAQVASVYGLPGPGLRAAAISRNKVMQRLLCERHGVPVPPFTVVSGAEQAARFLAGYAPVVAKPCTSSGSDGVRRLDCEADLVTYTSQAPHFPFLLEKYLHGREFSIECLVSDGQPMLTNITAKGKGAEPYFVETLQAVPAQLTEDRRAALAELAVKIIELTEMETGILHLEAVDGADGTVVYPIEWAVREPGHAIMDLVDWCFGLQATDYLVALHVGRPLPEVPAKAQGREAVTVFVDLPPGTIVDVRQDRDPNTIPGIVDFDFFGRPGDVTDHARDNWNAFGAYSVLAHSRVDLRRAINELDASFGVLLREPDGRENWWRMSAQVRAEVLGDSYATDGQR